MLCLRIADLTVDGSFVTGAAVFGVTVSGGSFTNASGVIGGVCWWFDW
jgi:ABC-type uncharacterized transport system permease subunit